MNNKNLINKAISFLEHIKKPMKQEDVHLLYRVHRVVPERINLYLDFIITILNRVTSTYLGDDVTKDSDIKKHFDWCWDKTINDFQKESIDFKGNTELYTYFYSFFIESFYSESDKTNDLMISNRNFWFKVFSTSGEKTRSELDTMLELYKIFDKSINKL